MSQPDSRSDVPLKTSIPKYGASLESILCTEELRRRPSRPPDYHKENAALVALVSALADSPDTILQTLADTILEVTQADSAGLSLLTRDGKTPHFEGKRFYWPAIAGMWNPHVGGGTPRDFGPCGDVLDQNRTLLFRHFERRYPYLLPVIPAAEECLLVPFYVAGKAVGTIWGIMHSDRRKFDAEDDRVMASLGKFASSAYQALAHIEDLRFQVAQREKAEAKVRQLASGLEAKIRRLVDANIMGVFIWDLEGKIVEANEAFLNMVQYDRGDLVSGRMRWTDLTPAEWRDCDARALAELTKIGTVQPYEKEFFRKNGGRIPVLAGGALFEESEHEGVAFVLDLSEQKRAEETLRQSEQRWRTAFENSAIGIMMRDLEGRYIAANSVFQNMLGYTESELCRLNFTDVTYEEDREANLQLVGEILQGKRQHYQIEKRYRRKDGALLWVRNNVALVPGLRDAAPFLFAVVEDVTQRKQEESARRYSEERYRVVVETANDAVVSADESGAIQFANPATTRVFGYDPAELIGQPLTVLMPEFMRKLHENGFKRYLATGQRHTNWQGTEFTGLRKNGQEFQLEVSFGELTTNGHRVFTGFMRDITERKQAEDTFRLIVAGTAATTGNDFFQSLVQHMAQALRARYAFVTTCDDQKRARSLAFWKGNGFGEDFEFDIADTPCEKVLRGNVCHYRQGLQRLFPLDKLLVDWQAESYLGVPMIDHSNRVIGHIAILDSKPMEADLRALDLLKIFASRAAAELKRQRAEDDLQAALQERERLRNAQAELAHINRVSTMGELTASLAHEIKQPISAAMTDAQTCMRWLACERPEVVEAREAASRLVKDVTRASEIIGRIGSLFKKHVPKRELIDVNQIIREMIGMMRSEALRHSISIHAELADGLPQITADRVGLQQVLMNLMLNGIEAMKDISASGTLTIMSRRNEDGQLAVSIFDTGVGVSPEKTDQIFSAFVTSKPQGTGMGLPISRSIIESHGGRLWATSNNAGPGAAFHFVLPIEPSAHQTA